MNVGKMLVVGQGTIVSVECKVHSLAENSNRKTFKHLFREYLNGQGKKF